MKNKIIEKPKFVGCLNCSAIPKTELDYNKKIDIYGVVILKIDKQRTKYFNDGEYRNKPLSVKRIMKKWGKQIKQGYYTELTICRMMHSETYEYDKKTNKWYLVKQELGIA